MLRGVGRPDGNVDAENAAAMLRILSEPPQSRVDVLAGEVAEWLGRWRKAVVRDAAWTSVWLRAWPAVVHATNAIYRPEDLGRLDVVISAAGRDGDLADLDAWNTPVAWMVEVFLEACPTVGPERPDPFADGPLGRVREALLTVRYRLLALADRDWAGANLVGPLLSAETGGPALWRAVARARPRGESLRMIGPEVTAQAANTQLGRRTRSSLVSSLVLDSLDALLAGEHPAVDAALVQQVLRIVEDEIGGDAAEAVERFLVPFPCHSLLDYGLHGEDGDGRAKLAAVNDGRKGTALLRLLD